MCKIASTAMGVLHKSRAFMSAAVRWKTAFHQKMLLYLKIVSRLGFNILLPRFLYNLVMYVFNLNNTAMQYTATTGSQVYSKEKWRHFCENIAGRPIVVYIYIHTHIYIYIYVNYQEKLYRLFLHTGSTAKAGTQNVINGGIKDLFRIRVMDP